MKKEVFITLRIDYEVGELWLEVDGEVDDDQDRTTLLGYMASLIGVAAQYGGRWVPTTKLREFKLNQIVHTFAFPNMIAKEQFYEELKKRHKETGP